MEKEINTKYQILSQLRDRWSPRVFGPETISETELRTLFEAGRWAPSSNNFQPWVIIWGIKGSETYNRIMDCLVEFNQSWAKNAPALILGCFKKTTPDGKENFHALHDLGLFMGNVSAQAQHLGIALHQMAGLDYEKAKKEFNFTEDYHVATATAIGYYGGDVEVLPEGLQQEEKKSRSRKPQRAFTFNGNFNAKQVDILEEK